jgi:hypothetical protein
MRTVIQSHENKKVRIVRRSPEEGDEQPAYSSARQSRNTVEVVIPKEDDLPTGKASRQLAQAILAIFEVALLETNRAAQREKFSELLLDLLKRW